MLRNSICFQALIGFEFIESNHQRRAFADDHGTLDDILEFPDIAGPVIANQRLHRFREDGIDHPVVALTELLDEAPHQQRNVFRPFAQWRNADRKNVQAIVEIGSKLLFCRPSLSNRGSSPRPGGHRIEASSCYPSARIRAPEAHAIASVEVPGGFPRLVEEHSSRSASSRRPTL